MSSLWIITLIFFSIAYLLQAWLKKSTKLPPGPKPLPIIGHFHLLGNSPHKDLQKLSQTHGPIMYMRFGFVTNIVVSSAQAAENFLKTHDIVFANRPPHEAAKYISYEQRNISFAPYGPFWRNMRKLATLELLSAHKINSFQFLRKEELDIMIDSIRGLVGKTVDLSEKVFTMGADTTCRMMFGKKYEDAEFDERGLKAVIQEGMKLVATPNLGDYFPYLGVLDLQGLSKKMMYVSKVFDKFLEKIIDDHEAAGRDQSERNKDFVDMLLDYMKSEDAEFRLDRGHVKAMLLDLFAGSMDTSSTAIDWILADLFKHPETMKKVQDELSEVVGLDRMVEESDLDNLKYLELVVKESFRLHPVVPLLLPHQASQDCTIENYHIPAKARVTINVYAIGRDPQSWTDPDKFIPERFIGSSVDVRGRDFQLLPFGAGRRGCPGIQLGLLVVRLVVAQLLHCFDWELPGGVLPGDLDMTEEFGLVTARAEHLLAIPTYRLIQ